MPEEIEVDTDKLREVVAAEMERESGSLLRTIALSTALFAALAAITALEAGSTVNEALVLKTESGVLQAKASDAWSYYQARGLKAVLARSALQPWLAIGKTPPDALAAEETRNLDAQGKIKLQAEAFERERDEKSLEADHLLHQHHRFAQSVALLQVAIALGAIAALTRRRLMWWGSLALGLGGSGMFIYALMGAT
ncbi:MAG: DUF4337 domain-containing protein [Rhodanobacter sp.]